MNIKGKDVSSLLKEIHDGTVKYLLMEDRNVTTDL